MLPVARQSDLHVEEVGDDLVIYDHRTQAAHSLNAAAAYVWQQCDGARSAADIAAAAQAEGLDWSEGVVANVISELGAKDLLVSAGHVSHPADRTITRRVLAKAAVAALVPAIVSIATPASALVLSPPSGPPGDGGIIRGN